MSDNLLTREGRPSPDALLKAVQAETRGRLKIFLGAAPGVGKTWEMLAAAHRRLKEGTDVVIGVVETHGRADTEAMVAGLPVIPRKAVPYKGHVLEEMDLEAILARRPRLVLVDELAHSNAPGGRHARRYLDVEELLAAGIDVWTTMNIQHVESLNDIIARITRIRVRETVPDRLIDEADEVEVIDLTPDDLIRRLREGKVYVPKTAARALSHYFSPGNLTALRELVLRRTAQQVDTQLLDHMRAHAIPGPWAAGERVLVCVDHRGGAALVRYARRMAERLRAPWTALHIESPRDIRLTPADQERIAETMRLAERLGGETATLPGAGVAVDAVAYARVNNFTHIVVGNNPARAFWRPDHAARVLRLARDIPVHVVGIGDDEAAVRPTPWPAWPSRSTLHYLVSGIMVAVAVLAGMLLRHVLNVSGISLVFMIPVLGAAALYGLWPSLFACLISVLAYNFFFLEPVYTFTIDDPENVVTLFFFAITALIGSGMAARAHDQAVAALTRARTTDDLYQFSRKLASIATLDDLLWAVCYQIAKMLRVRVVILLPDKPGGTTLIPRGGYPPEDALSEADLAAANWCWHSNAPAGRGSDNLPGAPWLFLPLRTATGPVAVVGIEREPGETGTPAAPLSPAERRLLDALGDQAAVSIERIGLAAEIDRARLSEETERLRSALLTSISHDLRTPLSAILGAVSTLQSFANKLDANTTAELMSTISDEAERMGRFVNNLLDMTRLESGVIAARDDAIDLSELIGSALNRAARILTRHTVVLDVASGLPLLKVDGVLLEQVLLNLLDNATKYAPQGTTITLRAAPDAVRRAVVLRVIDEGPGIPPELTERIFDKFFRVQSRDHKRAGTGLGLAICRGFVEAMGGRIEAANRADRPGAVFTLYLPADSKVAAA